MVLAAAAGGMMVAAYAVAVGVNARRDAARRDRRRVRRRRDAGRQWAWDRLFRRSKLLRLTHRRPDE